VTRPSGDCVRGRSVSRLCSHEGTAFATAPSSTMVGRVFHTSYVPGRTRASLPRYLQMSDVMTSRSMPSRGTKYSFCRADAGICEAGGGRCWFLDMAVAEGRQHQKELSESRGRQENQKRSEKKRWYRRVEGYQIQNRKKSRQKVGRHGGQETDDGRAAESVRRKMNGRGRKGWERAGGGGRNG